MDSGEDDFVFYGTPIEREEDVASRKKKAVAENSGQLRTLPAWKQEVRDEEGRRRFHGAFTGGFSAGYYNTVGSKDGWTPQTFVSSRKNRAEVKQQNIMNFLDEDERDELQGQSLATSSQFDTFGFTAAEVAHKQAEKEQKERPSAIPGLVPDEIILPATESIGVKLLLKMGWRRGRSIKDSHVNSVSDARREARRAFIALSSDVPKSQAPEEDSIEEDFDNQVKQPHVHGVQSFQGSLVYPLTPKQDLYGLGFDPYKNAPEFRERKRSRVSGNKDPEHRNALSSKNNFFGRKGKVAPGFGIGALEELDAEDDDVFTSEYDFEESYVQEIEEPSASAKVVDNKQKLITYDRSVLPGFRVASNAEYQPERFDPPLVPKDFVPYHKFCGSLETEVKIADVGPPEVPPPTDNNLKLLIDGVASLVARCGKLFEDLSREKNKENPLFNFLAGGNGEDYYERKLWEARQKQAGKPKPALRGKTEKLTAESRGKILGERPLEKTSKDETTSVPSDSIQLQYNLVDTFTKPASLEKLPESVKPFKDDPAKQERFEQFFKQKYEGGLRTIGFGGASYMSEDARARERLDFEAATEAIEKGNLGKEIKNPTIADYLASGGLRFSSGGSLQAEDARVDDLLIKKIYPKREEFQWRPSPILCKRFDLIDPYLGKPPPAPRMRSKIDNLIFTAEFVKGNGKEESGAKDRAPITKPQSETRREIEEVEAVVEPENVERPVDLYKAIFSDDSDDEDDATAVNEVDYPEKKVEVVNTALSRLMASDFLESLGKELGIELPPEPPYSATEKEINNKPGNNPILTSGDQPPSTANLCDSSAKSGGKHAETGNDRQISAKTGHRNSSSDSEYEKQGRHSRRHRRRGSDSDSYSSGDDRSRGKRKKSSGDKSSRKHRKHREHKHRDYRSSEKERSESRREKRRRG